MKIRNDKWGSGRFGASRDGGKRKHKGVDFISTSGEKLTFPIPVKFVRMAYPYSDNTDLKGAVFADNLGNTYKIFYIEPNQSTEFTTEIGTAQDVVAYYLSLNEKYKGMTNHYHVEMYDKSGTLLNPENHLL